MSFALKILTEDVLCIENIERSMRRIQRHRAGERELMPSGKGKKSKSSRKPTIRWTKNEDVMLLEGKFLPNRTIRSCINRLQYQHRKGNIREDEKLLILKKIRVSYANKCC